MAGARGDGWRPKGKDIQALAKERYGSDFLQKLTQVATRLGLDPQKLLTVVAWETSRFRAIGPPWPVNGTDGGGGLIGWTPLSKYPKIAVKGPVGQLDDLEAFYRGWMERLKLKPPLSMCDTYLVVRGPGGIGKGEDFDMGGGMTKGKVCRIISSFYQDSLPPGQP